jgi:hypothetical protein
LLSQPLKVLPLLLPRLTYQQQQHHNNHKVSLSGNLIYSWKDFRLAWDTTLTPGLNELPIFCLFVPVTWIWMPDIQLSNLISNEVHGDTVELYSDGTITWNPTFALTATCDLDLRKFPFDSQTCKLRYISQKYKVGQGIKIEPAFHIASSAKPVSWSLDEVTNSTKTEFILSLLGKKSVAEFSFQFTRYNSYYWTTAIGEG